MSIVSKIFSEEFAMNIKRDKYLNDLINRVDEYVKKSLIKMIVGPQNSFDASWEEMKKKIISMGIKDVEEEITNLIQMKIKLWSLD